MFKALILWAFCFCIAAAGLAFGFFQWITYGVGQQRAAVSEELGDKVGAQVEATNYFINNLETNKVLKVYLGLNRSSVPLFKAQEGALNIPSNVILEAVGSFLPEHIENGSFGFYFKSVNQSDGPKPYVVVIRSITEPEKIDHEDSEIVAYFVPREKFTPQIETGEKYFIEDSVNKTYSDKDPSQDYMVALGESKNDVVNLGNDRFGGSLAVRKFVPGSSVEIYGLSSYEGWEPKIRQMLKEQHWQILLGSVGGAFFILLLSLLYYADGMKILSGKVQEFESRFAIELDKILNQQLAKQRREAQREISDGVFSALKKPLDAIGSEASALQSDTITKEVNRISRFLQSLRASNNPGQISQSRSHPTQIVKEMLPDWEVQAKKYGAVLKESIQDVGEISISEYDIRAVFKNILEFVGERVSKNMYPKNVNVRLEQDQQGLHFAVVDNLKLEGESLSDYKDHMALAIAIGTLERNQSQLDMEFIPEGGMKLSFDLSSKKDQSLESLTAVSIKLDES